MSFEIVKDTEHGARSGRLHTKPGSVDTPCFFLYTQRGAVPHLTTDNVKQATSVVGAQLPLHNAYDVLEALSKPGAPTLHEFLNMKDNVLFLMQRDPMCSPPDDSKASDAVLVPSVGGKKKMTLDDYIALVDAAKPDIVEALYERCAPFATDKQQAKSVEKSLQWTKGFVEQHQRPDGQLVFAVVSGAGSSNERQRAAQELSKMDVQGFSIEGFGVGDEPGSRGEILDLVLRELPPSKPRAIHGMGAPELILDCVSKGVDIFDGSFPYLMSEAGFAMTFLFGTVSGSKIKAERCIGLWDTSFVRDNGPLLEGCQCFTCKHHTRAYIHHLLNTHEMLAEVLLMMHNIHHYSHFFQSIRKEIDMGTFHQSAAHFAETYMQ